MTPVHEEAALLLPGEGEAGGRIHDRQPHARHEFLREGERADPFRGADMPRSCRSPGRSATSRRPPRRPQPLEPRAETHGLENVVGAGLEAPAATNPQLKERLLGHAARWAHRKRPRRVLQSRAEETNRAPIRDRSPPRRGRSTLMLHTGKDQGAPASLALDLLDKVQRPSQKCRWRGTIRRERRLINLYLQFDISGQAALLISSDDSRKPYGLSFWGPP